jgi:hypothetical protein
MAYERTGKEKVSHHRQLHATPDVRVTAVTCNFMTGIYLKSETFGAIVTDHVRIREVT